MASRSRVAIVAVLTVLVPAALALQVSAAPKTGRLVAFRSCSDLLGYAKAHAAPFVSAYGFGRPVGVGVGAKLPPGAAQPSAGANSKAQQGVDYSGTNVQEAGVDEPDLAKTNGTTLFAVENNQLESLAVGSGSRSCSTR